MLIVIDQFKNDHHEIEYIEEFKYSASKVHQHGCVKIYSNSDCFGPADNFSHNFRIGLSELNIYGTIETI